MKNLSKLMKLLLVLALVFTMAVPAFAEYQELTEEQFSQLDEALRDESKDLPIAEEFRVKVDPNNLSAVEGLDKNVMNILLLGTDTGNINLNYGRTDTMIIMSVNKLTGKIKLASLVRDMQVNIPFHNRGYKINAANAFGGPLLAIKTVNETFGLNIRHYVSINFSGFTKVIDSLGGVEMVLVGGEAMLVGVPYSTEPVLLNGEQALNYVRIRQLDDNFGRNERQRKLLSSLFNKMLSTSDMQSAMAALTESLKHMATNLSISDLMTLVIPVFSGMDEMETTGFPVKGDYYGKSVETTQGMETIMHSVIIFNKEKTTQKMHEYFYGIVTP